MPPANDLTDADRAGMSPEEQEALEPDEEDKQIAADLQAILDEGTEAGGDEEDETKPPEGGKKPPKGETVDEETETEEAEQEGSSTERFRPEFEAKPVENYDKQLKDITDKKAAIRAQRDAGELEPGDAETQLDALNEQRSALAIAQARYEDAVRYNEATAKQEWQFEVRAFLRDHKEYVDQVMWDALDSTVKRLATEPALNDKGEPVLVDGQPSFANADKDANWFLTQAHKQVTQRLKGIPAVEEELPAGATAEQKAKAEAAKAAKAKEAAAIAARKKAAGGRPTTLAGLPAAADAGETGGNRFAALDALEGMELENAVARLPKADQDAYLRGE